MGASISNATQLTTSDGTNDGRALQQPDPQTSRILSAWRSPSETFHVATNDGNAHTVAFYMLDVYSEATAQTVTAQTTSAQVLDAARPFSGIQSGTWVVYTICGSVDFVFTGTAGNNGVYASVSGVFFGPPPGTASTTNMLVDAAGGLSQVVAETDGSGKLTAYYVRAGDELLEVMRPGTTPGTWSMRHVHHDGVGSVRALTDETGTTTDTRGYEAFGTKNAAAGSDPLPYGFSGEPFESTAMLAYHRARWMDSRVGRFATTDNYPGDDQHPIALHKYLYGWSNPVTYTDPTGLVSNPLYGKIVHDRISADFRTKGAPTGCAATDRWISTIIGSPFPIPLRPDLVNTCAREVYEIKPILGVAEGYGQLFTYLLTMNLFDPTTGVSGSWVPGTSYVPPSAVDVAAPAVFAVVGLPLGGVIPYEIVDLAPILVLIGRAATLSQAADSIQTSAQSQGLLVEASLGVVL